MKKAIILSLIFSLNTYSQDTTVANSLNIIDEVSVKIDEIKSLKPESYVASVNGYRTYIEKYIDHKKRVCSGEFSSIILSNETSVDESGTGSRLNDEERELCFRELKALQVNYINNMFVARKAYLDYSHQKRVEELSKVREKALADIQSTFAKKSFRRKKKK